MSVPPFTFRPLVSGLAGPVREAQSARFRSLTRDRQKRSEGSADDFRPLGAERPLDEDLHDEALDPAFGDDETLLADDPERFADETDEDAALGAVDAYGAGDVIGEASFDDGFPGPVPEMPIEELREDAAPPPDAVPEGSVAPTLQEPTLPVGDAVPIGEENAAQPPPEQVLPAPTGSVLPEDFLASIERLEADLVARVSDELCAVIAGPLRDLVDERYLEKAIAAFAAEIDALLGQQLGGAVVVSGPKHLIDRLTAALDDEAGNRVQFIMREGATELSANYDSQTIATRSAEIRDAFERAFAG
ncbi:MAG: hypothetical protein AAF940_04620 [Pseudomonadota bacterium]